MAQDRWSPDITAQAARPVPGLRPGRPLRPPNMARPGLTPRLRLGTARDRPSTCLPIAAMKDGEGISGRQAVLRPGSPAMTGGARRPYQEPVLGMLAQGSAGGSALPACSSSMEMPSGVRMKAMRPSRGGRLIVTPWAMKALQVS